MRSIEVKENSLVKATVVANRLNVHRATVYKRAKLGSIPCVYIGRAIRFDLVAVLEALESNQFDTTTPNQTSQRSDTLTAQ